MNAIKQTASTTSLLAKTSNRRLQAALDYAAQGLSVIQLTPKTKVPQTEWDKYQEICATSAEIKGWFREQPFSNIAIVTGAISGIVVLDCDSPELMAEAQRLGIPDDTPSVKTSSGMHYYFKHPGISIGNTAKKGDFHVRGDGGYVVAPPSIHPNGTTYTWEYECYDFPPMPAWLLAMCNTPSEASEHQSDTLPSDLEGIKTTAYGAAALKNEAEKVRSSQEGERNYQLNKSAHSIGQLVRERHISLDDAWAELENAALDCGLEPGEISRTLNSGLTAGMKHPRKPGGNGVVPNMVDRKIIEFCVHNEERGDALLLAHLFNGRLAYDAHAKSWHLWTGSRWKGDETGKINGLVDRVVKLYLKTAGEIHDETVKSIEDMPTDDGGIVETAESKARSEERKKQDKLRTRLISRAAQLRKHVRIQNVLKIASTLQDIDGLQDIAVPGDVWDSDSMKLGVENGVIDLESGYFRPAMPEDFIRLVSPTEWQGLDVPCPRFERFLAEIFDGYPAIPPFLQRLLGYSITGRTTENILPILWEENGRNGKDTLLGTLKDVLGTICGAVSNEVLTDSRQRSAGAAASHIVDLQGKRMAWASETREGDRLNAALIKLLTGGGEISARQLYGKQFTFEPTHKIFLMTNYKPHASADDAALWSRIILIPFNMRFVDNPAKENERKADKTLKETLVKEAPGILAWLVRGCLEWQRIGLQPPTCVQEATAEYQTEEDTLSHFVEERCNTRKDAQASASELYQAYRQWATNAGLSAMSSTAFGKRMGKAYPKERKPLGIVYRGIELISLVLA